MQETEKNREDYIYGENIRTDLGEVRFLTFKEYNRYSMEFHLISMNVLHIYYQYRKMLDEKDKEAMESIETLKKETLYNIVMQIDNFKQAYVKIFKLILERNSVNDTWSETLLKSLSDGENTTTPLMKCLELIFSNEELFMYYRELAMDMQIQVEDEVSPHPMIQEGIEMSRMVKSVSGEKQTATDIITSIVAGTANSFSEVCNMTVFQVYSLFYRLGAMKSYDAETLFATVSSEIKISSWSRNIDLFKREDSDTSTKRSEFLEKTGGLF